MNKDKKERLRKAYQEMDNRELYDRLPQGAHLQIEPDPDVLGDFIVSVGGTSPRYDTARQAMVETLIALDPNPPEVGPTAEDLGFQYNESTSGYRLETQGFYPSPQAAFESLLALLEEYAEEKVKEAFANHPVLKFLRVADIPEVGMHSKDEWTAEDYDVWDSSCRGSTPSEACENWLEEYGQRHE